MGAVNTLVGKLVMVDLVGSERMNKIGDNKLRQQEGINIDNSLSTLGNVLFALSKDDNYVSYQNNTLTYLWNNDLTSHKKGLGETFGRVTIEAMAFDLPVLGTNAGGTKEIVEHNVTGLGRPGSKVLAQNLLFLLNNPSEREQMGMRGRRKVEQMYLKHDMYEKFDFILFKCMRIK